MMKTQHNEIKDKNLSGKIGMWLFVCTELILFGGLFLLYSVYRMKNPAAFHEASQELSRFWGTTNTCILITSSFFVALSIHFIKMKKNHLSKLFLLLTILCAFGFLVVKTIEWSSKINHGIFLGLPHLFTLENGQILFFGLYFMMTGLHGIHVLIGIGLLSVMYFRIQKGTLHSERYIYLENSGLYWHLVDIVWIFLFPLFYLIS